MGRKLLLVGNVADLGGPAPAGPALRPGRGLKPAGVLRGAIGRTLAPVAQRSRMLGGEALGRAEGHARQKLAELIPEPGSLSDDLTPDEMSKLDEAIEGILEVVGELDTEPSEAVMGLCGAIYDAVHGGHREASGGAEEDYGAAGLVDVIGLEPVESGAAGPGPGRFDPGEWR